MFLIHNSLGEDSKIFDADEEPSPAGLFQRINENPDEEGELNTSTLIRNRYAEIAAAHPEVIDRISMLPPRVKSAKSYSRNEVNVVRKKGLSRYHPAKGRASGYGSDYCDRESARINQIKSLSTS